MKYITLLLLSSLIFGCASVERPYVNSSRLSAQHNSGMRW